MGEIVSFGDSKDSLRKRIILLRECMPVNERERASYFIFDNFFKLPEYQTSEIIFAFAGFESEVSTLNSIFRMINEGKRVALPKVIDDKNMEFYEVRKISDIKKGTMGIPEPTGDYPPMDSRPDVFLLPGVAFDKRFNRLGYGRGYYDRYLTSKGYERFVWKIAIAFSCQIVEKVPHDDRDIPVDMVITEHGILR